MTAEAVECSAPQQEMPFAIVQGQPLTVLPKDLYIPPDALEVFLEAFEGPLDLLLYLIKRQNLDILDIPIADITRQYMGYIDLVSGMKLELAAEYLLMAAMLAEIKSRMLLPPVRGEEEEEDPRAELVRRLQEYERIRQAAEDLQAMPRMERDLYPVTLEVPVADSARPLPDVALKDLLLAFQRMLQRAKLFDGHTVEKEALSVRERMSSILTRLKADEFTEFTQLFKPEEGRLGVVVSLLASLELIKESLIELVQSEEFAPIYLRTRMAVRADD
ncbi:MAG: ScpA family protein [Gammaproteobacteria bacterium]|nr:ScpA family protein [Gammaproteobacteria bacterium]